MGETRTFITSLFSSFYLEPLQTDEEKRCEIAPFLKYGYFSETENKQAISNITPKDDTSVFLEQLSKLTPKTDGKSFYDWIKQRQSSHYLLGNNERSKMIDKLNATIIAVMVKVLGKVNYAINYQSHKEQFNDIIKSSKNFIENLCKKETLEKNWYLAVEENNSNYVFEELSEVYQIKQLCEMKQVKFDLMKLEETKERLSFKLKQQIEFYNQNKTPIFPYKLVFLPVQEKVDFFLSFFESYVKPTTIATNLGLSFGSITFDKEEKHNLSPPLSPKIKKAPQISQERSKHFENFFRWIKEDNLENFQGKKKDLEEFELSPFISFFQSNATLQDLKVTIETQKKRAKNKIKVFSMIRKFLSDSSISNESFLSRIDSIFSTSHYLDSVESISENLRNQLENNFFLLFNQFLSILKNPNSSEAEILYSVKLLNLSYKPKDSNLIFNSNIFEILFDLIKSNQQKYNSAKNLFYMMSYICFDWKKQLIYNAQTEKLITQVLSLYHSRLVSIDVNQFATQDGLRLQSELYDILFVLNKITVNLSAQSLKPIFDDNMKSRLFNFLKSRFTFYKTKRLITHLMRIFLVKQEKNISVDVEFFLKKIGSLLIFKENQYTRSVAFSNVDSLNEISINKSESSIEKLLIEEIVETSSNTDISNLFDNSVTSNDQQFSLYFRYFKGSVDCLFNQIEDNTNCFSSLLKKSSKESLEIKAKEWEENASVLILNGTYHECQDFAKTNLNDCNVLIIPSNLSPPKNGFI